MKLILIILMIIPLYLIGDDTNVSVVKQDLLVTKLSYINVENKINDVDLEKYPDRYSKLIHMDDKLYLVANIRKDHRIFGFAKPSYDSDLMILFSIFTNDVEGNPFTCLIGSYYDTSIPSIEIKYLQDIDDFVKTKVYYLDKEYIVYFEKKWILKVD